MYHMTSSSSRRFVTVTVANWTHKTLFKVIVIKPLNPLFTTQAALCYCRTKVSMSLAPSPADVSRSAQRKMRLQEIEQQQRLEDLEALRMTEVGVTDVKYIVSRLMR